MGCSNIHAGTVRGPTDRPRRTLHVGYHNNDAYGQGAEPMPADAAESAKQAVRAFVAGVPSEYAWMYEAEQLVREHFAKPDSGYPDGPPAAARL